MYTSPKTSVPPPPTTRTAHSGATGLLGPCPLPFDLNHDLGQDLAAMAQQGRRINRERPAGHNGAPDTPDAPAQDRALAGAIATLKPQGSDESDARKDRALAGAIARAEASPPAAWQPNGPSC
jgi:hypothetical protein